MDKIYVLSSPDKFVINKNIDKIISKNKESEVTTYDLEDTTIDNILENLDTFNLFESLKIIVVNNCNFLTANKTKLEDNDIKLLEKYINNPSDNILILTCSKLDSKKKIVKLLKDKAKVIEEDNYNILDELKSLKEDYKVDNDTLNYLISYLNNDNYRIVNEFNKLKLLKLNEKEININDIEENIWKNIDDNIFTLVDDIISKNKKEAFEIYQDMLLKGEDPIKILVLLANKFRLLYQVKILSKNIYKDEDIANIIGSHPYPVKLARNITSKYREQELLKIIDNLAKLDLDIKSGNTYKNVAFEMFILSL